MKFLNTLIVGLALSTSAQGALLLEEDSFKNDLHKGAWNIAGGLSVYSTLEEDRTVYYEVNPAFRYFVTDQLGLGLASYLWNMRSGEIGAQLGPSLTFHFLDQETWSLWTGADILFGLTQVTLSQRINVKLGGLYFLTESVGLGPTAIYAFRGKFGNRVIGLLNTSVFF